VDSILPDDLPGLHREAPSSPGGILPHVSVPCPASNASRSLTEACAWSTSQGPPTPRASDTSRNSQSNPINNGSDLRPFVPCLHPASVASVPGPFL
jgi:hypothetical protein